MAAKQPNHILYNTTYKNDRTMLEMVLIKTILHNVKRFLWLANKDTGCILFPSGKLQEKQNKQRHDVHGQIIPKWRITYLQATMIHVLTEATIV